jgi:hypothetical protein
MNISEHTDSFIQEMKKYIVTKLKINVMKKKNTVIPLKEKFKKGDTVIVTKENTHGFQLGERIIIERIDQNANIAGVDSSVPVYYAKSENNHQNLWHVAETEIDTPIQEGDKLKGHTPGEWEAKKITKSQIIIGIKGYGEGNNYRRDNRCGQIAQIHGWNGDTSAPLSDEDFANAKLIASAPQLQASNTLLMTENEKLKETNSALYREFESLTPGGSEFWNDVPRCKEFVREELKGIKKALLTEKESNKELLKALKGLYTSIDKQDLNYRFGEEIGKAKAAIQKSKQH